jgi:hypothetical protein
LARETAVYARGTYVGSDPDANARFELRTDQLRYGRGGKIGGPSFRRDEDEGHQKKGYPVAPTRFWKPFSPIGALYHGWRHQRLAFPARGPQCPVPQHLRLRFKFLALLTADRQLADHLVRDEGSQVQILPLRPDYQALKLYP